ncbi:hypothetical protein L1785_09780 [Antribacter sp. KLBMP9083]|uniref:Uncharacterized protein n=1 Tax=Antribacter soli TaxID=2910976 RepID=A0AA41QDR5_9MICO|nr:hypothetical protein [Antribacter soli]MCF4121271.1 hypothetical protein [Antribacter soli]
MTSDAKMPRNTHGQDANVRAKSVAHWKAPADAITVVGDLPDSYRPPHDALVVFARIVLRVAAEQRQAVRARKAA